MHTTISLDFNYCIQQYEIIATYAEECEDGLHRKTWICPIKMSNVPPIFEAELSETMTRVIEYVDFGFGKIKADGHIKIKDELIRPRVEKMTVAEIEKILGYKVEIVAEE